MKRVLFLCTGNSCRSQMAEGFLRHLGGEDFEVVSAGVMPIGVNSLVIKVMDEVGINIISQSSKSIKEFLSQQFDYVITLCDSAKGACPVFSGECKRLDWNLDDPAEANGSGEEKITVFRRIRDQIKSHIELFLKENRIQYQTK